MRKLKPILIIGITSLMFLSCAMMRPVPTPEGKVYKVKGVKKKQIFEKSQQWIAENFMKAKEVIQYKNLEEGKIIAQAISSISPRGDIYNRKFHFTWVIFIKDEKVKIEYKNIQSISDGDIIGTNYTGYSKDLIDEKMTGFVNDMIKYIKGNTKNANW